MRIRKALPILLWMVATMAPIWAEQGFYIAPHVNNVTRDGVTLIWESREPDKGVVEYGKGGALTQKAEEAAPQTIHRVRLTGLDAGTSYAYRVQCGAEKRESTVQTAPANSRPITFVMIGDSRRWDDSWERTKMAEHTAQWKPEFFINMGDLVLSGHKYELWPEHFNRFASLIDHLWMVTVRGNHEGPREQDAENDWFGKYHELPGAGEPYATFDWGNTHFVLISSEAVPEAATYLDEHLDKVSSPYTVVAQHFPIYCTGYWGPTDSRKEMGQKMTKPIADALDRHHVPLNLAGHTHTYERTQALRAGQRDDRNGCVYVINGGDINANYPEEFSAATDDRATMEKPTYTVFHMGEDRTWLRTFCWGRETQAITEIDYQVTWRDEAVPKAEFDKLAGASGAALVQVITELGAMGYAPAAEALLPHLASTDPAVAQAAATALRRIANPAVSMKLTSNLHTDNLAVRREIARTLEIAMTPDCAKVVEEAALDSKQDDATRVRLIGALQFHADASAAKDVALRIFTQPEASAPVRERAAYALGVLAEPKDAKKLASLFREEPSPYGTLRLAFTLNRITNNTQNISDKGEIAKSAPGASRDAFIDEWLRSGKRK